MRIAALGRTHWLYDSIRAAREHGHEIVLIVTAEGSPEYRVQTHDFARLAQECRCPFICDANLGRREVVEKIVAAEADVAISVNWPTVIRRQILDLFPHGVLNLHAGDLPRYRGNACPNWAILAGEKVVVLTVHQMIEALDAGAIWRQRRFPLTNQTYIAEVYRFIEEHAPEMFVAALDEIAAGTPPRTQSDDPAVSLRCFSRFANDGEIDWCHAAEQSDALVRASAEPFAGSFSYLNNEKLIIWRAFADQLPHAWMGVPGQVAEIRRATGEVVVLTGAGVLVLQEVSRSDGIRRKPAELIRSTRLRLGLNTTDLICQLRAQVEQLEEKVCQLEQQRIRLTG